MAMYIDDVVGRRNLSSLFNTCGELFATLDPVERDFFDYLDLQVDKAETFYKEREKEAIIRASAIKEQFRELGEHRQIYYVSRYAGF